MTFVLRSIAFVVLIISLSSWAKPLQDGIESELRLTTVFISVEAESTTGAKITSSGSGFVVNSSGYVLTAGHVIPDIPAGSNRNLKITGRPSSRYGTAEEMDFIGRDSISDFALLKFKNTAITRNPVHLGDPLKVAVLSDLYAFGFPVHTEYIVRPGTLNGMGGPRGAWITSIPLNPGDSGGPVFNDQGQVVAMVSSALKEAEGIKYVLPINLARNLLYPYGVEIPITPSIFNPAPTSAPDAKGKVIKDCATCPEMVVIPYGKFEMGSNIHDSQKPIHSVSINAFALGKTEVTQGQWRAMMGSNPSHFSSCGDDCPVENVSWYDAWSYIHKLNAKTNKQYRLPSEAEWEYACRASEQYEYCGSDSVDIVAWYDGNSGMSTHPVGYKRPNAFGLYDMSGNVWEWMEDSFHDNYTGAPTNGSAWKGDGAVCMIRGGMWDLDPQAARAAARGGFESAFRDAGLGFRVARMLP
ncbi:MAG: SUMF1/EgtB/PvdO family nonheme iron enzyme [Candidatus Nitrotoga sp.]|nr:SUMF1/EgtB/PvdO family nonheme iron enzyme [Candidatus Nitrotoga sp.]MDP1855869.1 SUMF1/EgtB/PvdO family nonheme iron enzyme [Candidatus Nitrotoga sp.]